LEDEPEKGKRCLVCFDDRLDKTAQKADELGERAITTTLLTSPKKSYDVLVREGEKSAQRYGVDFIGIDLKRAGGTQRQNAIAKEERLYRQNYCGCLYALSAQRSEQHSYARELISPITRQLMPGSIEERIAMYEELLKLEQEGRAFMVTKNSFLNYRLLRAYLRVKKETVPSYFLYFSSLKHEYTRGKVEREYQGIYHFSRSEVKFVTLDFVNHTLGLQFDDMAHLLKEGLTLHDEVKLRERIDPTPYSKSTLIVVQKVDFTKAEIYCKSEVFEDVKESLQIIKGTSNNF
jgi:hypothetical protein